MSPLERFLDALDLPLGHLGSTEVTLFGLLEFILLVAALFYVSGLVRWWTVNRLLTHTHLEAGVRQTIGAVLRYALLIVGILAIAQTMGINLTTLNVVAGAVGVGVGFGLQNIVSNFISGLIIMLERPVRVGDRVELPGPLEGAIEDIGARRTTVRTDDNVTIIVPNTKFITDNVVNLRAQPLIRVRVLVHVAPGTDADAMRTLLLRVAAANPEVLPSPAPHARLIGTLPDRTLAFELQVWTAHPERPREALQSALNYAIAAALKQQQAALA